MAKKTFIKVYMTEKEKKILAKKADKKAMSTSSYVRRTLLEKGEV